MTERYSNIHIRGTNVSKKVRIGSALKPAIVEDVISKWQSLLNVITEIVDVPSGLIMKLNEDTIEVFLSNKREGNPYERGEKADLFYGLYCETVIGTQNMLLIPDATKSPVWKDNNPDVQLNMISYLGVPVNWPDGEVFGTICILDNKENHYSKTIEELIFQVKQNLETDLSLLLTRQEMEEKNLKLVELNRIKDKFFSIIAHDLRSPFHSFLGFTNLLADDITSLSTDQIQTLARKMRRSATMLQELLENLLEWSAMQVGTNPFNPSSLKLGNVVQENLVLVMEMAAHKNIEINDFIPEDLFVFADENMFASVMRNLISNAVKFTSEGGKITISAVVLDSVFAEISIRDTGIGMNHEMLKNLFIPETKINRKGTNNEASTGLGLIICKEFVEKNGGILRAESEEGKGTTFSFTIPLQSL